MPLLGCRETEWRRPVSDRFRESRGGLRDARGAHRGAPALPQVAVCAEDGRAALIECVADPLKPPMVTKKQTENLTEAIAREENRVSIGLTLAGAAWDEKFHSQSPFGIAGRLKEALVGGEKKK